MRARPLLIVGLGQIGASVALGLRAQGYPAPLSGMDVSPEVREGARSSGLFVRVEAKPGPFIREYSAILVAVPVDSIPEVLKDLQPWIAPGTWVSDTGSVKGPVVERVSRIKGHGEDWLFLGGHPMAGTERAGWEGASSKLFSGAFWIFTPTSLHRPSLRFWRHLVLRLGAKPRLLPPPLHDEMVALTSHLPYLVALTFMDRLQEKLFAQGSPDRRKWRWVTAGSFASATRVAAGDPRMSLEMIISNRGHLEEEARTFSERLLSLLEEMTRGHPSAFKRVETLRRLRQSWY
ncbi:MAG: prephenate dehydrogenase/arogenate dehydrogenase family protein [Clostridiales bacterium]|nr:prephenate dehydrogenase/arogenate dehydrogenase family protein [Clostridiales bacterium]MBT9259915.1 prephenate dehydrogenase/arogenate dehydrogenase family protein [Clostridiales bacterium]